MGIWGLDRSGEKAGESWHVRSRLDWKGLRVGDLVSQGVEVSEIVKREYMPKGEMELRDPDGWKLFVGGV